MSGALRWSSCSGSEACSLSFPQCAGSECGCHRSRIGRRLRQKLGHESLLAAHGDQAKCSPRLEYLTPAKPALTRERVRVLRPPNISLLAMSASELDGPKPGTSMSVLLCLRLTGAPEVHSMAKHPSHAWDSLMPPRQNRA